MSDGGRPLKLTEAHTADKFMKNPPKTFFCHELLQQVNILVEICGTISTTQKL